MQIKILINEPVQPGVYTLLPTNEVSTRRPDQPEMFWSGQLGIIKEHLDDIEAPKDLYAQKYWRRVLSEYGTHPDVVILSELNRCLDWWEKKGGARDYRKAFSNWLRRAVKGFNAN